MATTTPSTTPVMAFYHKDGFVAAWKQAARFSGAKGRIATLPDIIAARLASKPETDAAWEMYFTTASTEYLGIGKNGRKVILVAHGIGPMSTLDGILAAYSNEYKDQNRQRRGGRISQEEFLKLEAGEYGDVASIDFVEYVKRYQYPFLNNTLRLKAALTDPLLLARLGNQAEAYLNFHAEYARQ